MVSFSALLHADLGKLETAAEEWRLLAKKYQGLAESFDARVTHPLKSGWEGEAADRARTALGKLRKQYEAAAEESGALGQLLRDAHEQFHSFQKQLRQIKDDDAPTEKLRVSDAGTVIDGDPDRDVGRNADPDHTYLRQRAEAVRAMKRRIDNVVQRATVADEALNYALRHDPNGAKSPGFNTTVLTSLDAVEADQALALTKKGPQLTDEELSRLHRILDVKDRDSGFATAFYRGLGQKRTLEFFGQMCLTSLEGSKERQRLLEAMQHSMGNTLATATDSDNRNHLGETWSKELRRLGTQRIKLNPDSVTERGPYGYQLLGGILRYGDYDSTFLRPIAEHVAQLHEKNPYMFGESRDTYGTPKAIFNPSGRNGAGYDPVTSVMEALGHSPKAAQEFFTGPMHAYHNDGSLKGALSGIGDKADYFEYFTDKDYKLFPDVPETNSIGPDDGRKKSLEAFPDSLGHALEAATTSQPWDGAPDAEAVPHSQEQADLVQRIVHKFSSEDGVAMLNGKDHAPFAPMRASLGRIGAAYMGDLQGALADPELPTFGAPARLDRHESNVFLSQVGQDPDAYAALTASQQAYTAARVDEVMNGETDSTVGMATRVETAVHPGAAVAGVMSEARAEAIHEMQRESDKTYNEAAANVDKWVGRGLGLATGAIKVPVIGDAAGWVLEDLRSSVLESIQRDTTEKGDDEARRDYTKGQAAAEESAKKAVEQAGRRGHMNADTIDDIKKSAATGAANGHDFGAKRE